MSALTLKQAVESNGWVKVTYATIIDKDYLRGLCKSHDLEELFTCLGGRSLLAVEIPNRADLEKAFGPQEERAPSFYSGFTHAEIVPLDCLEI